MPKGPAIPGASALRMAQAILGDGVRVIGASFSGDRDASGLGSDGSAVLSTGSGETGNTSHIDIDFIPETDHLALGIALVADDVPLTGRDRILSDGLTIWINGQKQGMTAGPGHKGAEETPSPPVAAEAQSGLRIGMKAILGVWNSKVNSIRITTRTLGAAAVMSALAVRAEAMGQGKAVGNPGTGNNGNDGTGGNAGGAPGQGGDIPGQGGGNAGGAPGQGGGGGGGNFTAVDDTVGIPPSGTTTADLIANDIGPGNSAIFITEINGTPVVAGDTVTVNFGDGTQADVTLNADGTVTITTNDVLDNAAFTYTAAFGSGNAQSADTATVTLNTIPCFVAGTKIRTPDGERPVEKLKPGDLVLTRDDGAQPIRWAGRRRMPAEGDMAPIEIAANTFGRHRKLRVSPLHRILVKNVHAELLFGSSEVLIAARDLIDGHAVRQVEGGNVDYVHFLFDRHQVVWSNGLLSESFLPGPQTKHCFEREIVAEICAIFPELDPDTGEGYGPTARPALKRHEARLLSA